MLNKNDKNRKGISGLCEDVGRVCIFTAFAYSVFVIVAAALDKEKNDDYQERLRKAYSGLSPEDY